VRGTPEHLRPGWAHYFGASDAKEGTATGTAIGHTTFAYVIDPQGQVRVFLPANFDPKDLVTDVRVLARTAR